MEKLIRLLKGRGYRIGSVKHAHKGFEMDKKGKDSWRLKTAGSDATLVISPGRIGLVKDFDGSNFQEAIQAHLGDMDIVLVEGLKRGAFPKIEIFRQAALHQSPLCMSDHTLAAFVTDSGFTPGSGIPVFHPDDTDTLADFIVTTFLTTA